LLLVIALVRRFFTGSPLYGRMVYQQLVLDYVLHTVLYKNGVSFVSSINHKRTGRFEGSLQDMAMSGVRCFRILDIPPLITLADMDKCPHRFEGSLQDIAI